MREDWVAFLDVDMRQRSRWSKSVCYRIIYFTYHSQGIRNILYVLFYIVESVIKVALYNATLQTIVNAI
jgi:hypothetical protein